MKNKNILMTEVRTYESQGDYTVKITLKSNLEWIEEDDLTKLFEEVNTPTISRNLLNGDKCRKAYSIYNGGKIGTDGEVIEFVEKEMKKEIDRILEKTQDTNL